MAAVFRMAVLTKVSRSKEQLAANMGWVEDFSPGVHQVVGATEIVGALGVTRDHRDRPDPDPDRRHRLAIGQLGAVVVQSGGRMHAWSGSI